MDDVMATWSSSDESSAQEVRSQTDVVADLHNQIQQLLDTTLSDNSIMVLQEEMRIMHRSSYYLEIQCDDLLTVSGSMLRSLLDQQRLKRAKTVAKWRVKLLLAPLRILYREIVRGCQALEEFVTKYDQDLVDVDITAYIQQKLQQTQKYLNDFKSRKSRFLGLLNLQYLLIPNPTSLPISKLSASLAIKMPVIFDRFKTCVTSNSVYLCWEVIGQQSEEPNEQFELHVNNLHPVAAKDGQFFKCICRSHNLQVVNLIPDRYYHFSVKRAHAVNLVYGVWIDAIILKTLDCLEQNVPSETF